MDVSTSIEPKYIKGRGNYYIINPRYQDVGRHSRTKISNLYHQSKLKEET